MIALDNVPSGVLQGRLARYAEAAAARAALLLLPRETDFVPAVWWTATDPATLQGRLVAQDLAGPNISGVRIPAAGFSLNALLEGETFDDPAPLLLAAGLDESLGRLPAEVAAVRAYASIPLGPRASRGMVLLALSETPSIPDLRRAARELLEPEDGSDQARPLIDLAAAFNVDLARLYRVGEAGQCRVVCAWQAGGTTLPEVGESLAIAGTPIEAVVDSEDSALVETATRGDWLSALCAAQGIRTSLFSPLFSGGNLCAVLEIGTRRRELPLASIGERIGGFAQELVGLVEDRQPVSLLEYGLVRSFVAQRSFSEDAGVDRLCVEVLRPDGRSIQFVIGSPLAGGSDVVPLDGSATEDVIKGEPALVSTERVNGWFNQALLAQGFRTVLRVPLRYNSELLGVLSLVSRARDAFATSPEGLGNLADQLSVLVAAERSRLQAEEGGRRGDLLTALAGAMAQCPPGETFAAAAQVVAEAISADAIWLTAQHHSESWPEPKVWLPPAARGEVVCRGQLEVSGDNATEDELARRGYKSALMVPCGDAVLICAAKEPFAFDAETIALVAPAARLMVEAHRRDVALEGAGGIDIENLAEAVLIVEGDTGTILQLNAAARDLLKVERGGSLWGLTSSQGTTVAREKLAGGAVRRLTFELTVIAEGRQRVFETQASRLGDGLWQLSLRDVSSDRSHKHLLAAIQEAVLAAQSCASESQLQEAVIRALSNHDLGASFRAVTDREGSTVTISSHQATLELGHHALTIARKFEPEDAVPLESFRASLLAAEERIHDQEQLRSANQKLSEAVAARTAELEGLFAFSRDLNESESDAEALHVGLTHLSAAIGAEAGAAVCLESEHLGEGADSLQVQAENLLLQLQPGNHEGCRRLLRSAHVPIPASDAARALIPTRRGGGAVVVSAAARRPDQEQLKLLLSHVAQLGAALDRLGSRRAAEESRLRSIADVVEEGIALVDPEGVIRPENVAATRLLNELTAADGRYDPQLEALIEEARGGESPVGREIENGGRTLLAAATAVPGSSGRVALTLRDVTEQRLTQERLAQSERLAALGQLVSGVAHELNNPLTGILGYAQLLQDQPLEDEARRGVETIQSEAERAGKIIQDLLSFARRRPPRREQVDINELISRVLGIRSYDIQGAGIDVELALAADLPPIVGDGDQLQQVFFNVLTNAMQAVQDTPGPRIAVTTSAEAGDVIVRVTDNGPGVLADDVGRVFEPFFTTKKPGEGTGLGLSISYGIIRDHEGRIELRNEVSGGATTEIQLPALASESMPVPVDRIDESPGRSAKILVVDDEASIRDVLSLMLRGEGHQVIAVEGAAEALTHLAYDQFDLVITDLKMPEISGQELYQEIRASDPHLGRRVIFITGDTVNEETREFISSVENPTLEKPFRLERLRELIRQALA
ncbi:MAG TPA: ATP-binding protein [Dehalococcoidia bacterium]|nr:ATP-binding protein [Dehalococcoidia bacterium]